MIRLYLPHDLIPQSFEEITFEELFALVAKANYAREMRIEDIKNGSMQAVGALYSE